MYRTSTELLKKEKFFFENSAGEYSNLVDKEKNELLVERVESIVSAETSKYKVLYNTPTSEEGATGKRKRNSTMIMWFNFPFYKIYIFLYDF